MSKRGIQLFSSVLEYMQTCREALIRKGSKRANCKSGQIDMRLGQMLDEMEKHAADEFIAITTKENR